MAADIPPGQDGEGNAGVERPNAGREPTEGVLFADLRLIAAPAAVLTALVYLMAVAQYLGILHAYGIPVVLAAPSAAQLMARLDASIPGFFLLAGIGLWLVKEMPSHADRALDFIKVEKWPWAMRLVVFVGVTLAIVGVAATALSLLYWRLATSYYLIGILVGAGAASFEKKAGLWGRMIMYALAVVGCIIFAIVAGVDLAVREESPRVEYWIVGERASRPGMLVHSDESYCYIYDRDERGEKGWRLTLIPQARITKMVSNPSEMGSLKASGYFR